ncbi:unnamed protein product [Paramecium primaurelia]|uniref:Uncharacterized protein n=1 Tax=Paramecium primaurelia TaxID=5886 RepID=A0A8S1LNC3_PARPR|nr:unnamed protein product [Paramecium primaurelia]
MINLNIKPEKKQKYKSVNSEERMKIIKYFIEGSLSASQGITFLQQKLFIEFIEMKEEQIKKKKEIENSTPKKMQQTRYLKFIIKQQMKKEIILRNHEKFSESQDDIVNITLQKAANEIRNNLNSLQSKKNFDQSLESIMKNGIKEKEIINIPFKSNFQFDANSYINVKTISNLFKQSENLPLKKTCIQTPQKQWVQQKEQINDLKRIFELQVQEYLGKSQQDNLK